MDVAIVIKTWVNKALILAYVTLFCFLGISTKVHAERLFILDNLITNGDFNIDTDNNGLADGWNIDYVGTKYIYDGNQQVYSIGGNVYFRLYQNFSDNLTYGHLYYLSYNKLNANNGTYRVSVFSSGNSSYINYNYPLSNVSGVNDSFYFTANGSEYDLNFIVTTDTTGILDTSYWIILDNVILIDLTNTFGYGYEPSLQDFELYYLPDLVYFDTLNSFEPEIITSITDANYTNLQENLTGIDYTKSIIDNDGKNIDLDLSLYFYDTVVNGTTISGIYSARFYVNTNHPTMKYNNEIYTLNWVFSDYSERVIILELTDKQELILKKILFNRYIDRDNEYFNFKAETRYFPYAKMWFTIGSKFDLLVDVKSFLLSRETITQNDFNIINEMYIKTYDTDDNLLLPSLKMNIADTFRTVYVDDFGSQYTNISKFNFEFLITSPDRTDDYMEENHYFYEIGIFSSDKVLHPSFIEGDIDSLWDMKTCDWYQIGCHLSNFANEVLTTTYNKLNIDAIIAFFDGIIDDVTQVVDTVPSGVKTVFAVLFTGLGVALIIVIIEKMNR